MNAKGQRTARGAASSIGWILVSTLSYATLGALVKTASSDVSIAAILVARSAPTVIALWAFAAWQGASIRMHHWRLHLHRCAVGIASMAMGLYAIRHLPLAVATTLEYTAPLFLVAGYALMTRSMPRRAEIAATALGFAGVLVLLRPTLHAGSAMPFAAGLLGGAFGAMTYRTVRRLGEAGEPGWRIVLVYSLGSACVGALLLPFAPASSYSATTVLLLLGVGIAGLLAQFSMTLAFLRGPTALLAAIQYATVVFSAAYGVVFWREVPTSSGLLGLVLIVVSGAISARVIVRGESGRTRVP